MLRTTIVVAALFAVAAAVPIVDRDLLPVIDHSKINEINSMQVCASASLPRTQTRPRHRWACCRALELRPAANNGRSAAIAKR